MTWATSPLPPSVSLDASLTQTKRYISVVFIHQCSWTKPNEPLYQQFSRSLFPSQSLGFHLECWHRMALLLVHGYQPSTTNLQHFSPIPLQEYKVSWRNPEKGSNWAVNLELSQWQNHRSEKGCSSTDVVCYWVRLVSTEITRERERAREMQ